MAKNNSIIIKYPSFPKVKNEFSVSENEQQALYDIIIEAFRYKYKYEKAKSQGRECYFVDKNLNNIKVYSYFLSRINSEIKDPFLRSYIFDTISSLKSNDYSLSTVKKTYDTINDWFVPGTLKGNLFRINMAEKSSPIFIDFQSIFEQCNKVALTEDSPCFKEVKKLYQQYLNSPEIIK